MKIRIHKIGAIVFTVAFLIFAVNGIVLGDVQQNEILKVNFIHNKNLEIAKQEEINNLKESGIVGGIIGALIGVLVASILGPIIFNRTAILESDTAGDLSSEEESLIGTWPIFVILSVTMGLVGLAM